MSDRKEEDLSREHVWYQYSAGHFILMAGTNFDKQAVKIELQKLRKISITTI